LIAEHTRNQTKKLYEQHFESFADRLMLSATNGEGQGYPSRLKEVANLIHAMQEEEGATLRAVVAALNVQHWLLSYR